MIAAILSARRATRSAQRPVIGGGKPNYGMSKIWVYSHGEAPSTQKPKFAPLREGPMVLVKTGDGIMTPTPLRLVEIANYLATEQK